MGSERLIMNKVCIVGHPTCGLHEVERLLRQCGMLPPQPSRRDGMTPLDITQALLKAHQCEPVEFVTDESALAPIKTGPVWHGMALDLLLGNLDQPFWGWADPNTIYLLEYWRELDPHLVFVLVYDHPGSALCQWADTHGAHLVEADLHNPLDNWSAYNGALLRFYLRHPDRCLLFSAEHMHQALDAYLQQMGQKLQRPTLLTAPESADHLAPAPAPTLPAPLQSAAGLLDVAPEVVATLWQVPAMESYLIDDVLKRYPSALQLYAELQSAASLPPAHTQAHKPDPALAWQAFLQHRQTVINTLAHLIELHERSADKIRQLLEQNQTAQSTRLLQEQAHSQTQQLVSEQQLEISALRQQLEQTLQDAKNQAKLQTAALAEHKEENELLLNQLHQVQEELERQFAVKSGLHGQIEVLQAQHQTLQKTSELQAQKVADLEARLQQEAQEQQTQVAANARALQERDALRQANDELLTARRNLEQVLNDANARAEQQTAALAEHKEENDLLLNQLHQVQEELERYYLENQKLKAAANAKPAKPKHYGAAERVKQQLTYRLGARVIQQNQTFWGKVWLLPALWSEARAFKREQAQRTDHKLPPIHQYADAHEAERAQQHLSYRLGMVVRRAGYNPFKWPMLPFALHAAAKAWKQENGHA